MLKSLAVLVVTTLVGEAVVGLLMDGTAALVTLIGEATRLLVLAALLWAAGDLSLLMIHASHDLRVTRILLRRANTQGQVVGAEAVPPEPPRVS